MNTRKGFTLVELLVVIAILAILATVSVVGYTSFINRAEDSNAQTEAHQVQTTIQSYTISGQSYVLGTTVVTKTIQGDNPDTADVTEESYTKNVTENVVVDKDGKLSHADAAEIAENDDLKGLNGELYTEGGKLYYVVDEGTPVEIKTK